jgi:hypothetical protein
MCERQSPDTYTVGDVGSWLEHIGLPQFVPEFKRLFIDGGAMLMMDKADLQDVVDHPVLRSKIVGSWAVLRSAHRNCNKGGDERHVFVEL